MASIGQDTVKRRGGDQGVVNVLLGGGTCRANVQLGVMGLVKSDGEDGGKGAHWFLGLRDAELAKR